MNCLYSRSLYFESIAVASYVRTKPKPRRELWSKAPQLSSGFIAIIGGASRCLLLCFGFMALLKPDKAKD